MVVRIGDVVVPGGTNVWPHELATAKALAMAGHDVEFLPRIEGKEVKSADVLRVMRNTLAMSGISLLFSWFPMIFAVFLNEIKCKPYRKFVQTATTLPNFISWVLVFSVAFSIFGTNGALNGILLETGVITEPISFLKSSEHVWFRMWLWLTWKNAGWALTSR